MKVLALVTTSAGRDESGKRRENPPGVIELPEHEALRLIALGHAKPLAQVAAEAEATKGQVQVTQAKGPQIIHTPQPKADKPEVADEAKAGKKAAVKAKE